MAKITAQERKLAETLRDPMLWGQAYLFNRDGSTRRYWDHQVGDLRCEDKNIIHLDGKEVKKRTKELMTSLINGAIQRKQLIFPAEDLEIEDQFTTHTYTLRDGKIIYSKGNDHVIDAVRCAMLMREEGNLDPIGEETVSLKPVFTDPVFI